MTHALPIRRLQDAIRKVGVPDLASVGRTRVGPMAVQVEKLARFIVDELPGLARVVLRLSTRKRPRLPPIIGRQFGCWKVIRFLGWAREARDRSRRIPRWRLACVECGFEWVACPTDLRRRPSIKGCAKCRGWLRPMDVIGSRFGTFVVEREEKRSGRGRNRLYRVVCSCGAERIRTVQGMRRGHQCSGCRVFAKMPKPAKRVRCNGCERLLPPGHVLPRCYRCRIETDRHGHRSDGKRHGKAGERAMVQAATDDAMPLVDVGDISGWLGSALGRLDEGTARDLSSLLNPEPHP